MKLSISGKQMELGDAFKSHIEKSINELIGRYFDDAVDGTAVISKHNHLYTADVTIHLRRGFFVRGHAETSDPYVSFDMAIDKLQTQINRYSKRLRDQHRNRDAHVAEAFQYYVLSSEETPVEIEATPTIIAELDSELKTMSVSEAVMQLDLTSQPALMFKNAGNGTYNMIYRRQDGHIGWINPKK